MKWINDGDVKGFLEHLRNASGKKADPTKTESSVNVVEQLKELAALKEQGILTEEEFQKQKEKILNG